MDECVTKLNRDTGIIIIIISIDIKHRTTPERRTYAQILLLQLLMFACITSIRYVLTWHPACGRLMPSSSSTIVSPCKLPASLRIRA